MKKNINLNPITYTCICKKAIWETYSLSDRKNISINIIIIQFNTARLSADSLTPSTAFCN